MYFTAPSKTFLVGEYSVLNQGSALVALTSPSFKASLVDNMGQGHEGIHPESPAGKLLRKYNLFDDVSCLAWEDPHNGQGGFGASGAQFIFAYHFIQLKQGKDLKQISAYDVWAAFRNIVVDSSVKFPASGADVLSQMIGGISYLEFNNHKSSSLEWAFEEKSFFLVRTGRKIPTHEHLQNIRVLPFSEMEDLVSIVKSALENRDWKDFIEGVADYRSLLEKEKLVADYTFEMVEGLLRLPEVELAKGCGALGADVLFITFSKENKESLRKIIEAKNLVIVACENSIVGKINIVQ